MRPPGAARRGRRRACAALRAGARHLARSCRAARVGRRCALAHQAHGAPGPLPSAGPRSDPCAAGAARRTRVRARHCPRAHAARDRGTARRCARRARRAVCRVVLCRRPRLVARRDAQAGGRRGNCVVHASGRPAHSEARARTCVAAAAHAPGAVPRPWRARRGQRPHPPGAPSPAQPARRTLCARRRAAAAADPLAGARRAAVPPTYATCACAPPAPRRGRQERRSGAQRCARRGALAGRTVRLSTYAADSVALSKTTTTTTTTAARLSRPARRSTHRGGTWPWPPKRTPHSIARELSPSACWPGHTLGEEQRDEDLYIARVCAASYIPP